MPKLVMIRGPAGSGKSTCAKILQKKLGMNTALIEMDYLYYHILQNDVNHKMVFDCMVRMADIFLKNGYTVILEGVFTVPYNKKTQKLEHDKLYVLAKKHNVDLKIFFLDVSLERAIKRDIKRHGKKRLRAAYIQKLNEKTHARRHEHDIEINTSKLSSSQVVNKMLQFL
ncbi:MAG: AAA family ATPase [Candidatus Aenigmarchaeota archaeon]|nr:AAA family ATPase [Candidatus Aenigmarchaeota archaeon]